MSPKENPFKKIIKKSNDTQKRWDTDNLEASVKTRTCDGCGAPRPKQTNLTTCAFCGFKFMTIDVEIKND